MVSGLLAPWHIIIIALLVVVVFGSKRLPQSARAIGQSMRILKAETRGLREDDSTALEASRAVPAAGATPAPTPVAGHVAPAVDGGPGLAGPIARYDAFTGRPLDGPAAAPQ